jgi:hypothetical protein
MNIKSKLSQLKLNKTAIGITVLVIIVSIFSIKNPDKSNPPLIPLLNLTPTPSEAIPLPSPAPLEVVRINPPNKVSSIADTNTAIYFTFNRELTLTEMQNIEAQISKGINLQLMFNKNRKIIYVTPDSFWKNNTTYTVSLKFTDTNMPIASHTFTANNKPPTDILKRPEIFATPSPAL